MSATLVAAACVPISASPPQQVNATNPSVTYTYSGDAELIAANQKATAFCAPYQGSPQATSITTMQDGGKAAVFECVKPAAIVVQSPQNFNLTSTYQTDQELLAAARNAHLYCISTGMPGLTTSTTTSANGNRTVAFQCTQG